MVGLAVQIEAIVKKLLLNNPLKYIPEPMLEEMAHEKRRDLHSSDATNINTFQLLKPTNPSVPIKDTRFFRK